MGVEPALGKGRDSLCREFVCLVATDTMHFLFSEHPNISKASRNKGHISCPLQVEAEGKITCAGKSLLMFSLCCSWFSVFQRMDSAGFDHGSDLVALDEARA